MSLSFYLQDDVRFSYSPIAAEIGRADSGVMHSLQFGEAISVAFLAYFGERMRAQEALTESVGKSAASKHIAAVIERFWPYFGGDKPRSLPLDRLSTTDLTRWPRGRRRDAAPAGVIWLTTLGCNRRCPYCFYQVFHHAADAPERPADATFSFDRAAQMIADMAAAGTPDLFLTGGEPLLRGDLLDLVALASRVRVRTTIATKFKIDRTLAQSLADAGVGRVVYSLDDGREKQADGLAGAKDFFGEALLSIRSLTEAGCDVEVNAVATAVNLDGIESLAKILADIGPSKLSISPYALPYPLRSASKRLQPSAERLQAFDGMLERLQEDYTGKLTIEKAGSVVPSPDENGHDNKTVCDVGLKDLHVLPNGDVTRCRYLPDDSSIVIGSLEQDGLIDIWRSERMRDLVDPPRTQFAGTPCADCSKHTACNTRGRCIVSAQQAAGRHFAPDAFCAAGAMM